MKRLFVLLLLAILAFNARPVLAQFNLDEALAAEYYQKGEFDKAAMYYKKLFEDQPQNRYFYEAWLNSMLQLKQYDEASKELKKFVKKNPSDLVFAVDLAHVYELSGDNKESSKAYDEILKNLTPSEEHIHAAANAYKRREKANYVLETYKKGRQLLNNPYAFTAEIADIYKQSKEYEKMIDEYMKIVESNPYDLTFVKENLQEAAVEDEPFEILRKAILKKVQANPDNLAYTELLNWLFIQRKDFMSAFIQAKSLDKRLNEGGRRLVDLGNIAAKNHDYTMAEKIYQSVLDQGKEAMYYIPAQRGLLDVMYDKVTQSAKYTQEDIQALIREYSKFIENYGMARAESGDVVLKLAEIQAQYSGEIDKAIELLQSYIEQPRLERTRAARAKLALADYLLLKGDGWESTLLYGQVEKAFKDDPLGHEAKFRNARLSFYRGDFEWAKAQLDVLKSSTSELIANNAMQLALLIQDNIGLDSNTDALRLYAEADFLIYKNLFADAQVKLDTLASKYPNHTLDDDILMSRANMAAKQRDFTSAAALYEKVYTQYGFDILADDALFKSARLYEQYLENPDKAKELYEKLILEHKGSVYTVEARQRYRELRGDVIN